MGFPGAHNVRRRPYGLGAVQISPNPEPAFKRIPARTERRDRTTIVASTSPAQNGTYACARGSQALSASGSMRLAVDRQR